VTSHKALASLLGLVRAGASRESVGARSAHQSRSEERRRSRVSSVVDALDASSQGGFVWRVELNLQHGGATAARRRHESAIHADFDVDVLA